MRSPCRVQLLGAVMLAGMLTVSGGEPCFAKDPPLYGQGARSAGGKYLKIHELSQEKSSVETYLKTVEQRMESLVTMQEELSKGNVVLVTSKVGIPVMIRKEQVPEVINFLMLREAVEQGTSGLATKWLGSITDENDLPRTPDDSQFWHEVLGRESQQAAQILPELINAAYLTYQRLEMTQASIDTVLHDELTKLGGAGHEEETYQNYLETLKKAESDEFSRQFWKAFEESIMMPVIIMGSPPGPPPPTPSSGGRVQSPGNTQIQPNLRGLEKDLKKMDRIFKGAVGR